jgi:hypothetical protein
VAAPTADELKEKITTITQTTYHFFATYGAEPNLKQGTTNTMLFFTGKGAAKAREDILINDKGKIHFETGGTNKSISCTTRYKHVGGIISANGELMAEAKNTSVPCGTTSKPTTKPSPRTPTCHNMKNLPVPGQSPSSTSSGTVTSGPP